MMSWKNIRLIFQREVRDQLRDRRTLFTITVLPLVLYPLLGMSFLQVTQFMQEHPTRVELRGREWLPKSPALLAESHFADPWCNERERELLNLQIVASPVETTSSDPTSASKVGQEEQASQARREIESGKYDAILLIPPHFAEQLEEFRKSLRERASSGLTPDSTDSDIRSSAAATSTVVATQVPEPQLYLSGARDKSRIAAGRVEVVLKRWREAIVAEALRESHIPENVVAPFAIKGQDVAEVSKHRAATWSKVLPFVVLIWALTGAFYPAVDLCAGEKERGTLETLLSSPAERSEIVWGKLLTVMLFSVTTALLNMVSITITSTMFVSQLAQTHPLALAQFGSPPIAALGWLIVALLPVSALFSALALAVASFARSSKEGQYYLMPLLFVMFPLMILSLMPGVELSLGTSLIPVTGVMLLLRALIEGQYIQALTVTPTVFVVTAAGCYLAIRWAVEQFNNENVLFRESERWDMRILLRHFIRDREATPTFAQAMFCGMILLVIRFFVSLGSRGIGDNWQDFSASTASALLLSIFVPPLFLTLAMTRSPRATLLLYRPRWWTMAAVIGLAITVHPISVEFARGIRIVYPVSADVMRELQKLETLFAQAPSVWSILLLLAFTPAICEELAFRGFILTGLRSRGSDGAAILISAVFFAAVHSVIQQSIHAFGIGLLIGFVAVHTRSIWPCMLFHLAHNSLQILVSFQIGSWMDQYPVIANFATIDGSGHRFSPVVVFAAAAATAAILYCIRRKGRSPSVVDEPTFEGTMADEQINSPKTARG